MAILCSSFPLCRLLVLLWVSFAIVFFKLVGIFSQTSTATHVQSTGRCGLAGTCQVAAAIRAARSPATRNLFTMCGILLTTRAKGSFSMGTLSGKYTLAQCWYRVRGRRGFQQAYAYRFRRQLWQQRDSTCSDISTQILPMSKDNGNRPDRLRTFQPDEQLPPARTATPLGATLSILLKVWCNLRRSSFAAESTAAQMPESVWKVFWWLTFHHCYFAAVLPTASSRTKCSSSNEIRLISS